MKLTNLLRPIKYSILQGESEPDIEKVTHDSREVERDTLFVCIKVRLQTEHYMSVKR